MISNKIFTIYQLNNYIKSIFDNDILLSNIFVKGEISNFKYHSSGHMYFTLKDDSCSIKAVMFKSNTKNLKFMPSDGQAIIASGSISVFERDGQYQLYCNDLIPDGLGSLYLAYEQLKNELEKTGYFDISHKKPIPKFPNCIGVITSKTGAVIRDIINVSTRRNPNVNIKLIPASVQGITAAEEICNAIYKFNKYGCVDVIIIARGGGSIEDLWPFNERKLAIAIYNSSIPIISAVGHETDFTISDFVADLRAPTPSAAAELVVPDISNIRNVLLNIKKVFINNYSHYINIEKNRINTLYDKLLTNSPINIVNDYNKNLSVYREKIKKQIENNIKLKNIYLCGIISKLDALSPLKTLSRGFCVAQDKSNNIIKSIDNIKIDQDINLTFNNGYSICKVTDIKKIDK